MKFIHRLKVDKKQQTDKKTEQNTKDTSGNTQE